MEENEVFNNRFDGICLATGVEPQLSSEWHLTSLLFSTRSVRHCCVSNNLMYYFYGYSRSDNKVHGNRREVEKAIESCRCLFQVSGNTCYPMHDFYRCVTCMFLRNCI